MDVQAILKLMKEMQNSGITTLEWEADGQKLQITRPTAAFDPSLLDSLAAAQTQIALNQAGTRGLSASTGEAEASSASGPAEVARPKGRVVSSPVVGVFYAAASPDQDPFVSIGSRVSGGTPLGIIEAMKLMNEVTSPCSGLIVDILVDNAQRVEYGQPLFVIEES